jgi:hypothetical protein
MQPNGQPFRGLDTTKAKQFFGFEGLCHLRMESGKLLGSIFMLTAKG